MKSSHLKMLIKEIIKEVDFSSMFSGKPKLTKEQEQVVYVLQQRSFKLDDIQKTKMGVVAILSRPFGKGKHGGPRFAVVKPNGKINQDDLDINRFLQVVGEAIVPDEFKSGTDKNPGVMGFVNTEMTDNTGRYKDDMESGLAVKRLHNLNEDEGDNLGKPCKKCHKGTHKEMSQHDDMEGKVTCDKCGHRIDRYTTNEQSVSGGAGAYSTPFAFKKTEEIDEVLGFGAGLAAGAAGAFAYRSIKDIISKIINNRAPVSEPFVDRLFSTAEKLSGSAPGTLDPDLEEVKRLVKAGKIKTVSDLNKYVDNLVHKEKGLEENFDGAAHIGQGFFKVGDALARKLSSGELAKPGYEKLVQAPEGFPTTKGFVWLSQRVVEGKMSWVIRDSKNWIMKDGRAVLDNLKEQTGTSAVAGYATPFAFSKKGSGAKRAIDVTKKMGYKVVGPSPRV